MDCERCANGYLQERIHFLLIFALYGFQSWSFFYPSKKTGIKLPEVPATKVRVHNWKALFRMMESFLGGIVNGKQRFRFDT